MCVLYPQADRKHTFFLALVIFVEVSAWKKQEMFAKH